MMTSQETIVRSVLREVRPVVLGLAIVAFASGAQAQFAHQGLEAPGMHSFLVANTGEDVEDADFARWIKDLLVVDGKSRVRNAKFLFQECFGGGMLDDLLDTLHPYGVSWIGGAACKYNECALGYVSPQEKKTVEKKVDPVWVKDPPDGPWTAVLEDQFNKDDQTDVVDINEANTKDPANHSIKDANGNFQIEEIGQLIDRGGGQFTLRDYPGAKSHHAILWAGQSNRMRHFNNIKSVRDALVNAWGTPDGFNVTIQVFFRDGKSDPEGNPLPAAWGIPGITLAATRKNLSYYINFLGRLMGPDEQFFFYASDHGDVGVPASKPVAKPGNTPALSAFTSTFSLTSGELLGMRLQPDNAPALIVDYSGVVAAGAVSVSLNGTLLGSLDPNSTEIAFAVNEDDLRVDNEILIVATNAPPFEITAMRLSTGSIDTNPPMTLSKKQQSCVKGLTADGQAVVRMRNTANRNCVENAGKGKESDPEQCLTADPKGKIQKQFTKLWSDWSKRCSDPIPIFGATHADAVAVATFESLNFVHDVFGPDLSAGQISTGKTEASCQDKVIQRAGELLDTKLKEFVTCQNKMLPRAATYRPLEQCVGDPATPGSIAADTKGRIAKKRFQLGSEIAVNCSGVDTCAAFLGPCTCLTGDALRDCIDTLADCRVCLNINRTDNLAADCDVFDDGVANSSCPPSGSTSTTEEVGARSGGRQAKPGKGGSDVR